MGPSLGAVASRFFSEVIRGSENTLKVRPTICIRRFMTFSKAKTVSPGEYFMEQQPILAKEN